VGDCRKTLVFGIRWTSQIHISLSQ